MTKVQQPTVRASPCHRALRIRFSSTDLAEARSALCSAIMRAQYPVLATGVLSSWTSVTNSGVKSRRNSSAVSRMTLALGWCARNVRQVLVPSLARENSRSR